MIQDEMKQWAEGLLKQQQQQFMDSLSEKLKQPAAPEPQYSFDDDPEKAVKAMMERQMKAFTEPFQQQMQAMTEQLSKLSQQNDQRASDFMKLLVPEATPDESFDKEHVGIGSLTWGQLRGLAEQNNDVDGLRQYAEARKAFKDSSGEQEIPSAKARTPSPSGKKPKEASEEDVNNDMMQVMNGQMSKEDFNKKYGVVS